MSSRKSFRKRLGYESQEGNLGKSGFVRMMRPQAPPFPAVSFGGWGRESSADGG